MPGLSALVGEEIAACSAWPVTRAVKLIRREPDATIQKIVSGWATDFDTSRASKLGFKAETAFDDIIGEAHIDEANSAEKFQHERDRFGQREKLRW